MIDESDGEKNVVYLVGFVFSGWMAGLEKSSN